MTGKHRLEQRSEDDLCATELRKREPHDENELEGVKEREPVHRVHSALEDGQEGEDDPVGQPLSVIHLTGAEEGAERVVGGDNETGGVDEELSSDVEEDQEEVRGGDPKELKSSISRESTLKRKCKVIVSDETYCVDFRDARLSLEIVEKDILGQLASSQIGPEQLGGSIEGQSLRKERLTSLSI